MSTLWQVQEAKNRLSELMDRAVSEGPQVITRHGKPVVKVVAIGGSAAHEPVEDDGFTEFLLSAPKFLGGLPRMPRHNRKSSPFDDAA